MVSLMVFLLLMNLAKGSGSSNDISVRMSYFLTKLCPRSNICRGNASSNIDNSESTLCCTDCSCEPGCKNTGNCCFANNNQAPSKGTKDIPKMTEDIGPQCLYPVAGKSELTDFKNFRSYRMISSIVGEESYGDDLFEECGNNMVGPWGSLFPVFSKQANAIYKNGLCAKLDNIADGVFWEAKIKCNVYKLENLQAHLEKGLMPKECRVLFSYPGDFKDIQPLICHRDMIDFCNTTEFNVPLSINATKKDITEACQSGLVSPYYGDRYSLYSNVFCYICSRTFFNENPSCLKFQAERGPTGTTSGIFGLLNIDAILNAQTTYALNRKIFTVCPTDTEQKTFECRPVLCPSGQVWDTKGRCVFPMQEWYEQNVQVLLELNSEQEFDAAKSFGLKKDYITTDNIKTLLMPSLSKLTAWSVVSAFYKETNSNKGTNTTCLLLFMTRLFGTSTPINIIQNIKLLTITNWSLKTDNETLILKPSLLKMDSPDLSTSTSHFKENETLTVQRPVYKLFYNNGGQRENGILITKRHFCEQIELKKSEYYLSVDRIILYNKITKQYLFNGEFVVLSDLSEETVRICLEGSDFVKSSVASCGVTASVTATVAVFVLFTAFKVLLISA